MRLGLLAHASMGGSARVASSLADGMAERGHAVTLLTLTPPFHRPIDKGGVVVRHVKDLDIVSDDNGLYAEWSSCDCEEYVSLVIETTLQQELELLHFHYAVPFAFLAETIRVRLGSKAPATVGTLHGTDVSYYGHVSSVRELLKRSIAGLDAVTTVSRSHAGLAQQVLAMDRPPLVIPNFVCWGENWSRDDKATEPSGAAGGSFRHRRPRIAHVSNFRSIKNPLATARIFARIKEELDCELWLIGDGPLLGDVRKLFGKRYDRAVRYWGRQRDVGSIVSQSDILLNTSRNESFCVAALEALACGVPVVATRVGGLPEVVSHGKTGLLFSAEDEDEAVRLSVGLLSSPSMLATMSAAAKESAARFAHWRILPLYERLYADILQRRSPLSREWGSVHTKSSVGSWCVDPAATDST